MTFLFQTQAFEIYLAGNLISTDLSDGRIRVVRFTFLKVLLKKTSFKAVLHRLKKGKIFFPEKAEVVVSGSMGLCGTSG